MKPLAKMIAKRIGVGLLTLFLISVVIFFAIELLPGDAAEELLGQTATPETLAALAYAHVAAAGALLALIGGVMPALGGMAAAALAGGGKRLFAGRLAGGAAFALLLLGGWAVAVLLAANQPLAEQLGSPLLLPADVTDPASLDALFAELGRVWGRLDFLVHAVAFSDKEELKGRYLNTTLENFQRTMVISCFSFTDLARRAEPLMTEGGSLVTLSYIGAERVTPHYNVMGVAKAALEASVRYLAVDLGGNGIRVNAISAGPVRTLAASGIGDFRYILKWNEYNSPLKRNTTLEDVGGAGLYLLSELGSGTTGEVLHVDSGYHVVGMKSVDAPDISVVKSE